MKINFKHQHLRAQWVKLLIVTPELCYIVLRAIHLSDSKLYITHIFRTEAQQRKFYPKDPKKQSVHQYWRGVDLGVQKYGLTKSGVLVDQINEEFPYDKRRPKIKTALVHNIGQGVHLHMQTRG